MQLIQVDQLSQTNRAAACVSFGKI